MQTQLECIPCFIRQGLDALKMVTDDDETVERALRRILSEAAQWNFLLTPPEMGQKIHEIIREESKNDDPYLQIKKKADDCALNLQDDIKETIANSNNPFVNAVRFAISGNIMDFALFSCWDSTRINDSFQKALNHPVDEEVIKEMEEDIKSANTVLLLGDNTGETVLDRLLIEFMDTDSANAKIYYAAKESPIINDATVEDAIGVGLGNVACVISNGTNAPGTVLKSCSEEFLNIYNKADVVIAKGQANFETLNNEERKVYFLTQVKCRVIAEKYNSNVGDWLVTNTSRLKETAKEAAL